MCMTKRNIAECVKQLANKKSISKITIQDIMNETNMSRQSFYYHFKDIYDVLLWICKHDFAEKISYDSSMSFEDWLDVLFTNLNENRSLYEKIVDEVPWSRLAPVVRTPIENSIHDILNNYVPGLKEADESQYCGTIETMTTSICYDCMSFISLHQSPNQKRLDDKVAFLNLIVSMPITTYATPTSIIA